MTDTFCILVSAIALGLSFYALYYIGRLKRSRSQLEIARERYVESARQYQDAIGKVRS